MSLIWVISSQGRSIKALDDLIISGTGLFMLFAYFQKELHMLICSCHLQTSVVYSRDFLKHCYISRELKEMQCTKIYTHIGYKLCFYAFY